MYARIFIMESSETLLHQRYPRADVVYYASVVLDQHIQYMCAQSAHVMSNSNYKSSDQHENKIHVYFIKFVD